jgi:hypothetical protein
LTRLPRHGLRLTDSPPSLPLALTMGALTLGAGVLSSCSDPKPGTGHDSATGDSADDTADDTAADDTAGDGCEAVPHPDTLGAAGGHPGVALESTGFWRTERLCARWWLVTPEGHPAWSIGVNTTTPYGDTNQVTGARAYAESVDAAYASQDAWADATNARLRGWGFNTVGSWSDHRLLAPRIAATPILYVAGSDWLTGEITDWYDPAWEAGVAETVAEDVTPFVGDPQILGWFLDNEIRWGPDWRGVDTMLQLYLALDATAPGKVAAVALLSESLGGVSGINSALGTEYADEQAVLDDSGEWQALDDGASQAADDATTAWLEQTAERYFRVTTEAVRAVDPDHMLLGNREVAVLTRPEVYVAAAAHLDVISVNDYLFLEGVAAGTMTLSGGMGSEGALAGPAALVDLPFLISEFGFRADGGAPPNTWPPVYPTFADQAERAAAHAEYVGSLQEAPWIVGHHWFEWVDQPVDGRFDGEDNNWGLVNEQDQVYAALTERMTEVHDALWSQLRVPAE